MRASRPLYPRLPIRVYLYMFVSSLEEMSMLCACGMDEVEADESFLSDDFVHQQDSRSEGESPVLRFEANGDGWRGR